MWATPEKHDPKSGKSEKLPRRGDSYAGAMPDAGAFAYLLDYFGELGAGIQTGGAFTPLTWAEIKAWQDIKGIAIDVYDARTLLDMSFGYVEMHHAAKEPVCFPPDGALYLFENE